MDCERLRDALIGRLYGENVPPDEAALDAHLASCAACREELDDLRRLRATLRAGEPEAPVAPRVVVLGPARPPRLSLLAASILGAALLAGAAAGGGYAVGRSVVARDGGPARPSTSGAMPASRALDPATETAIRDEVARRVAAIRATADAPGVEPVPAGSSADARPVTSAELSAALARLERKVGGARAADLDYVLTQLAASEVRTGRRIGQTNEALRYVALASNPNVAEQ